MLAGALGCAPTAQRGSVEIPGPELPPAVLAGDGALDCSISSRENGHQKLALAGGQGLEFNVEVSPIVDGVVETHGAGAGGSYRFTSHLAKSGPGTLSGVGPVTIEKLETKVNVAMQRYEQPNGPGTELTFRSDDMSNKGMYVEFAGVAAARNGDHYAFRITLGTAGAGSGGQVTPASDAESAPIAAKVVEIRAPTTTVVTGPTRVVVVPKPTTMETRINRVP